MKKLLAFVLACGLATLPASAEILEQVLVKVNGDILTKTELEQRQVAALRQRNRGLTQADLENDERLKQLLNEITPQLLVDAVDEMLLLQRGKELGFVLTDERFNEIVANIRKENKLESEEQFQAALKNEGMTMDDLRKSLERQMLIARVQQSEVGAKLTVTDVEAKQYYEKHPEEFTTPASVMLREILVAVPTNTGSGQGNAAGQATINVAQDEAARERAERIRARVAGGEDFAKVAAAESDAASKANGGLVGPFNPKELDPRFQTILEKLEVGQVSEPIRTTRGYQIIKLESRTEPKLIPFEQARDRIADRVWARKRDAEFQKFLARLRAQAIIEWKSPELQKLYEQGLAKQQQDPPATPAATEAPPSASAR